MDQFWSYLVGVAIPLTLMALVAIGRWVRRILHQLEQVHHIAASVDSAVNHRPPDEPSIYDLVKTANEQAVANGEGVAALSDSFHQHMRDDEINFADIRARLAQMPQT